MVSTKAFIKRIWSNYTYVQMYPVSRGTWSVSASIGRYPKHSHREWTGLTYHEALEMYRQGWEWVLRQQERYKDGRLNEHPNDSS